MLARDRNIFSSLDHSNFLKVQGFKQQLTDTAWREATAELFKPQRDAAYNTGNGLFGRCLRMGRHNYPCMRSSHLQCPADIRERSVFV